MHSRRENLDLGLQFFFGHLSISVIAGKILCLHACLEPSDSKRVVTVFVASRAKLSRAGEGCKTHAAGTVISASIVPGRLQRLAFFDMRTGNPEES